MELLTYKEVAKMLGLSERKVWDLVNKDHVLKACKMGKSVRIPIVAVQEYINESVKRFG